MEWKREGYGKEDEEQEWNSKKGFYFIFVNTF